MKTHEIATSVVALLREGKFKGVYDHFFNYEDVRHIEPQSPFFPNLTGVAAIKEKDAQMQANIASVEQMEIGEPIVSKDHFAMTYKINFTLKDGSKMELDEIIVYQVKDGKIILEQFFY
ncbi:MAG: nuclear transport factor 2 family protein [Bacteroidota bacterium]